MDFGSITMEGMSDRIAALKEMLVQNPGNTFVHYGLAMELVNTGDLEGAAAEFRGILEVNPKYAAAYFHGGQTLEKMGRVDEAREIYQRGIAVTTETGDAHTRDELQGALDLLPL